MCDRLNTIELSNNMTSLYTVKTECLHDALMLVTAIEANDPKTYKLDTMHHLPLQPKQKVMCCRVSFLSSLCKDAIIKVIRDIPQSDMMIESLQQFVQVSTSANTL